MKPGLLFLLFVAASASAQTVTPPPHSTNRTRVAELPIQTEADAAKNFQIQRGFRLELVASEPMVTAPVTSMAFDENGRLFVLEMSEHTPGGAATGRLIVLEDADERGAFHSRTVCAENIANPTALVCYGGGVFVASAGQIRYFKDLSGNNVADVHREVFKSFGDAANGANGQVNITGLAWGLDNRIHAVTTGHGGDVISSSSPAQSVALTEGSFAFDPRTMALSAEGGSEATGMCFDDRGHRFLCTSSGEVREVMYDAKYEQQNPYYILPQADWPLPSTPATRAIYPAGAAAPVNFSSASSLAIYRGYAFPVSFYSDVFMVDLMANVVHRDQMRHQGIEAILERSGDERTSEFLASPNFQPTQVINGPDGALYLAGLLHTVQGPGKNNPLPTAAAPKARIYRIVPVNFKQPKVAQLGKLKTEQLVPVLRHPNAWNRENASRLIYERQDRAAIVPLIQLLFDPQAPALGRLHAMCALDGLELILSGRPTRALLEPHLLKALNDPDERVRERAVLLSEQFLSKSGTWSDALWEQLSRMGVDTSPQVRWQLALSLGQCTNHGRVQTLATIVRSDIHAYRAVLGALNEGAGGMFEIAANDPAFRGNESGKEFVTQLVSIIGKKGDAAEIARAVIALPKVEPSEICFDFALQLANTLAEQDASLETVAGANAMTPLFTKATDVAMDPAASGIARAKALEVLALRSSVDASLAVAQVRRWPYSDKLFDRQALASALLLRPEWTGTFIGGFESGLIPLGELSVEQMRFLLLYPNESVKVSAAALFNGWTALDRVAAINHYQGFAGLTASAEHGHALFTQNCQTCHYAPGETATDHSKLFLPDSPKEKLLAEMLNPNASAVHHPLTLLQTKNGELIAGLIIARAAKSVAICDWKGTVRNVGDSNIAAEGSIRASAMPESWESFMSARDMADLLEFIAPEHK